MAKFCGKCGAALVLEFELCPNCDKEKLKPLQIQKNILNFCTVCGAQMDKETGQCPVCTNVQETKQSKEGIKQEISHIPPKRKKFKTAFITFFMSILLLMCSVLSILIFCVRSSTSQDGAEAILSTVKYSELMDMVYDIPADGYSSSFYSFRDFLFNTAGVWITDQQFDSFMENSTVNRFVAEQIAEYADGIYTGSCYFSLTREDIYDLLKENATAIKEAFGVSVSDDVLQSIAEWLIDDEAISDLDISTLKNNNSLFYVLQFGFSYITMAVLVALCLLWMLILIRNNCSQAALGAGMTFTVIGSILSVATLFAVWLPSLWENIFRDKLIGFVVGKFLCAHIRIFGIILVVGVLLLVIRKMVLYLMIRRKTIE